MLIPKCCKNCANKYRGACSCTLPCYCNEWVEDGETFTTFYTSSTSCEEINKLTKGNDNAKN